MGKIIENVNFDEIPGFEPGTFRVRDQRATTALFLSLSRSQKTCVYKEIVHFCLENIEWSGSGVEQKSGTSHLFNLSNFEFLGFQFLVI